MVCIPMHGCADPGRAAGVLCMATGSASDAQAGALSAYAWPQLRCARPSAAAPGDALEEGPVLPTVCHGGAAIELGRKVCLGLGCEVKECHCGHGCGRVHAAGILVAAVSPRPQGSLPRQAHVLVPGLDLPPNLIHRQHAVPASCRMPLTQHESAGSGSRSSERALWNRISAGFLVATGTQHRSERATLPSAPYCSPRQQGFRPAFRTAWTWTAL